VIGFNNGFIFDGRFLPNLYELMNNWGIAFNDEYTDPLETLALETELVSGFDMRDE